MKGSKFSDVARDFVRRLSEPDLRYLLHRFYQRVGGDYAEAVQFLEQSEMDAWLKTAKSATEFFDMVDVFENVLQAESRRRFNSHEVKERTRA